MFGVVAVLVFQVFQQGTQNKTKAKRRISSSGILHFMNGCCIAVLCTL